MVMFRNGVENVFYKLISYNNITISILFIISLKLFSLLIATNNYANKIWNEISNNINTFGFCILLLRVNIKHSFKIINGFVDCIWRRPIAKVSRRI